MQNNSYRKLNCFDTYQKIEEAVANKTPMSLIRLGDGEGALMGYPEITNRNAINRSFKVWFGSKVVSDEEANFIADRIRNAVKNADIVGIPRDKQILRHPYYQAVFDSLQHYDLVNEKQIFTDAAIHRYLQFCLLFRKLLNGEKFLGLITPRDVCEELRQNFHVKNIKHHPIQGEARFAGDQLTPHFPEGFLQTSENIDPPYRGAIYLVGAGGLGKVYCQIIKERGGIALDVGALFDAWAEVKSRLVHPAHSILCYEEIPSISCEEAFTRFNDLCDHFSLDTERLDISKYKAHRNTMW